jgi:hypothetical protein
VPPSYTPPLHGDNPHGQGTVGTVDINPGPDDPLGGDPAGGDPMAGGEDVVLGRSRGEQACTDANDPSTCTYNGHVTALALFGNEVIGVDTEEGQTAASPISPLQQQVLDAICAGSTGQICLTVLAMNSTSNEQGSQNSFQAVNVHLGDPTPGAMQRADIGVASSTGNISDDGTCQSASGSSNVANANIGGAGGLTADVIRSSSSSSACNDGSPDQNTQSGNVINMQGGGVPIPPGCEGTNGEGVPNTLFAANSPLASVVCNAEDSTALGSAGAQTTDPYGVREGLTVFILDAVPLLKLTTAASESHAQAPPCPAGTVAGPNGCEPDSCDTNPDLCPEPSCETDPSLCPPTECDPAVESCGTTRKDKDDNGDGSAAGNAKAGDGTLPFTGANVLLVAMMGVGLLGGGLALKAGVDARHRNRA